MLRLAVSLESKVEVGLLLELAVAFSGASVFALLSDFDSSILSICSRSTIEMEKQLYPYIPTVQSGFHTHFLALLYLATRRSSSTIGSRGFKGTCSFGSDCDCDIGAGEGVAGTGETEEAETVRERRGSWDVNGPSHWDGWCMSGWIGQCGLVGGCDWAGDCD